MRRWMLVAGLAANLAQAPAHTAAQSEQGVIVRAFRYYRTESAQTLVTAFVEVPYALLEISGTGPSAELRYAVQVEVTDAAGAKLYEAAWPGRARADLAAAGARKLEVLDVAMPPGKYRIGVTVSDSVAGRQFTSSTDVEAWGSPPGASDLLLSPGMRLATGSDTAPVAGEIRRGNTLVTPATRLRLTPIRPKLFYLVEVYGSGSDSGTMQVRVADTSGKVLVRTRPAPVGLSEGGSVLKGQMDLSGLPAGRYTLTVMTDVHSRKEERSDQFSMADFEETMHREEARLAILKESDEGYFGTMNEDQLNEAEAPLIFVTRPESLSVWKSGLSLAAKRQFLTRFWSRQDPTPGTPRNERREQFYNLIAQANRAYVEGHGSSPGWNSDRGRVFVKYGEPADLLDRRTSTGKAPPYQVWRYSRGKDRYYIFADRTGFGVYKLIATNDLKESSQAGFRDILGPEALQDVSRWLGIDLFMSEDASGSQGP